MENVLVSNSGKKLKLISDEIDDCLPKEVANVLILNISGAWCGNISLYRKMNESDQNKFQEVLSEIDRTIDQLSIRMFKTTTPNFYEYVIVVSGSNCDYYLNETPITYDDGQWQSFFYAVTFGCLELLKNCEAQSAVFTHLQFPDRDDDVVKTQGLAIGNWWDLNCDDCQLEKIMFSGCGIKEDYVLTFNAIDPSHQLDFIENAEFDEDGLGWKCEVNDYPNSQTTKETHSKRTKILELTTGEIIFCEGEFSTHTYTRGMSGKMLTQKKSDKQIVLTFNELDDLDWVKNPLNIDNDTLRKLSDIDHYGVYSTPQIIYLRLPRKDHFDKQFNYLRKVVREHQISSILITDIYPLGNHRMSKIEFKYRQELLRGFKEMISENNSNVELELLVLWRFDKDLVLRKSERTFNLSS